jgi:hypothetical protein
MFKTLVCFAFGDHWEVNSDEEGFNVAEWLYLREESFGFGTIFVNVELEEEGVPLGRFGDYFGEGESGCCGDLWRAFRIMAQTHMVVSQRWAEWG